MPLTATPLQTSTKVSDPPMFSLFIIDPSAKDLAAMGRLTGIPYFFTPEAWEEEKEDVRDLRQARKQLPEGYDPLNDDDSDSDLVKLKQVEIGCMGNQKATSFGVLGTAWIGKEALSSPCHLSRLNMSTST